MKKKKERKIIFNVEELCFFFSFRLLFVCCLSQIDYCIASDCSRTSFLLLSERVSDERERESRITVECVLLQMSMLSSP